MYIVTLVYYYMVAPCETWVYGVILLSFVYYYDYLHYYSWAVFPSLALLKPSHTQITRELFISIAYIPSKLFAAVRFIYIIIFIFIHIYLYLYSIHVYARIYFYIHSHIICSYAYVRIYFYTHATIYTYKYTLHKICVYV